MGAVEIAAQSRFEADKLCYIHSQQALSKSEMANIRKYRATNPASGPGNVGMFCDGLNQWVANDSINVKAWASADDVVELYMCRFSGLLVPRQ